MTDFQKTMFEGTFSAITTLQDQTGEVVNRLLDQAPWIPEEGKKTIGEWVKAYNKGCKDYKKMIDDGFDNIERFFAEPEKKESAKEPEKKESAKSK